MGRGEEPKPWQRQFQSLMPFRVREILLVSSAYDAFVLEEDGSLSDRIFYEYSELNLSWAPRLTHTTTAEAALDLLGKRRFDLVVTVVKVGGVDAAAFSREVKQRHPDLPVALLIFDEADLLQFPRRRAPTGIDRVFQWTGSSGVLIAMIKSVEDQLNVAHDTEAAGVQVILVVEDRVRAYSSFLGLLYPELLQQSGTLVAEGVNDFHRLIRMRTRPKVLLANDYEQAEAAFERYEDHVCSLMADIRIPRGGVIVPDGGLQLARAIRERRDDLPILFQSAEPSALAANELGAWFVDKNARNFRGRVREFLEEALGFGDFVFRLPDRTEVGRATDVYEMEQTLATVPAESVAYHANKNHFSTWLRARSLFEIAALVRLRTVSDFASIEALRRDLIAVLMRARYREQEGVITDLFSRHSGPENRFVRVGRGSIGGKGRGSAFVNALIVQHDLLARHEGLQIRIPKTVALGTDAFDQFMDQFDIDELLALDDDAMLTQRMLSGAVDETLSNNVHKAVMGNLKGPLAVRSSSLLEDSRFQPFAGVYATYMLPNNSPDPELRFQEVLRAIKAVYASALWRDARNYLAGTPHDADDQKMAIVIQQVVGQRFARRFYPAISGVAQSYNYYPIGGQRPTDGVVHMALGLGHTVVSGGVALRFSPGAPTVLPQYASARAFHEKSQRRFWAVDLTRNAVSWSDPPEASLCECELADAEADGVLPLVGSVYSAADDVIRENFSVLGPRVVTFNNILKWNSLPVAAALSGLLAMLRDAMGEEVEIEFAIDIPAQRNDDAPASQSGSYLAFDTSQRRAARLYVLQLRPMTSPEQRYVHHDIDALEREQLLCRTDVALGHGSYVGIRDIVEVRAALLGSPVSRELAQRVGELNQQLKREGRPYLLVGPGRWGTSDPTLGVAVSWGDISGARIIVETPIGQLRVEPSQGTHFFRNITAARVGYLTVTSTATSWLDEAWLDECAGEVPEGSVWVRHIALDSPLAVQIDGRHGHACVVKRENDLPRR